MEFWSKRQYMLLNFLPPQKPLRHAICQIWSHKILNQLYNGNHTTVLEVYVLIIYTQFQIQHLMHQSKYILIPEHPSYPRALL